MRFIGAVALATVMCVSGFGCMATLTPQGAAVQPVTDTQKERACEFITIVAVSESMGSSTGADAQSAMNKARNAVAEAGGNAMRIISTDSNEYATTVTAEALKCDLAKLSERTYRQGSARPELRA